MEAHRHGVLAQRLDRMLQLDAPTVDLVPLARQLLGDVLGGDGAEELALFAGFARQPKLNPRERRRLTLGAGPLGLQAHGPGLGLRRDTLLVAFGRLVGDPVVQEIVARVPRLDPHHLAGLAEGLDVFAQDHFDHRWKPPVAGVRRRRKSSQVSARPSRVSPPRTNGSSSNVTAARATTTGAGTRPAIAANTAMPRTA